MTIDRQSVTTVLAESSPELLREVLIQAKLPVQENAGSRELAEQLTEKLWWKVHTPLGYQFKQHTLGSILTAYSKKLDIPLPDSDGWSQLTIFTDALLPPEKAISFEELSDELQTRVKDSSWKTMGGAGGAATAASSRWAATRLVGLMTGPIWKWLRFVPKIGPVLVGVRTAAGWVATLSGPLAIASAVYTVNQALGPRWDDGLPLLLGMGLVQRANARVITIPT